jgi:DNA repair exonuclease SbcCD ATPase subunit
LLPCASNWNRPIARSIGPKTGAEQAETRPDQAERAVADERNRAETGRNAERSRADELRDRIAALQVQLATAEADGSALTIETAELTAQLNQAVVRRRKRRKRPRRSDRSKPGGGHVASWRD